MPASVSNSEEAQLLQTIEMFEVITQSQPLDCQSLEILREAYVKLNRQKDAIRICKSIAQAYVQLGQISSAILEYEGILQQIPDDPDVKAALAEIESKANSFSAPPSQNGEAEPSRRKKKEQSESKMSGATEGIEDGREAMFKLFVEGKQLTARDFDLYWFTPNPHEPVKEISEPFIQTLADKGLVDVETSLKLLSEKARMAYLPVEKYDIDVEVARSFARDTCLRWGVLPFDRMSKCILVATWNPFNRHAARELEQATKHRLLWYLANPTELNKSLKKVFR